jgi:hypothetical protein
MTVPLTLQERVARQTYLLELEHKHYLKVMDLLEKQLKGNEASKKMLLVAVDELAAAKAKRINVQI